MQEEGGDSNSETELKQWQKTLATIFLYGGLALTVFHLVVAAGVLVLDSLLFIGGVTLLFFFTVPMMVFAWIGYGIFWLVYAKAPGHIPIRNV